MRAFRSAWGAVLLGLLVVAPACDRPGAATKPPARSGRRDGGAGLGIPYPVGEPERTEGWSRAALSRAAFAVVSAGPTSTGFDRPVAGSGPVLVGRQVRRSDDDGQPFDALLRRVFSGKRPTGATVVAAKADSLTELGFPRPAPSIFVVGPDGNCRAEVGDAQVSYYGADEDVIQVDWTLQGCDSDATWGPVGVIADRFPEDTVWVAAELAVDAQFAIDQGWQGPLAATVEPPKWTRDVDAALEVVRVLQIPGTMPTVVQVYDSFVRPEQADSARDQLRATGLDPACADAHATEITHGFWNGNALDAFAPGPGASGSAPVDPHLLGAFVRGEQVDGLVYDQRLDALVVIPPAPTMQGDSGWVRTTLPTAVHTAYARESWGYLPTSDPTPVGDPCELPGG